MNRRWNLVPWALVLAIGLVFSGCAGRQVKETYLPHAPEWVRKGSGAFLEKGQTRAFYGVGAVTGVQNVPLAIAAADNRARNEIAKILETYVSSLMRDYAASTAGGSTTDPAEEQHIEQAVKTVVSVTLSGVMIVDRWQDEKTGVLYSLARLDLDAFQENLERARTLNERVKAFIRENAAHLHQELLQEEARMRQRE